VSALPTGTVSLLFSDMEGSTALLSRLGLAYVDALDGQRHVLRTAWAVHGGTELGTEGDSFMVVFSTAAAAVRAAVQAQRQLAAFRWPAGESVRVRMGIHTGSPTVHDGGYVGMDVHRAARIAGAAHGGQVVVSHATAQLVVANLPEGVRLLDLGRHQLKDIPVVEHLFQVSVEGLPSAFPPLRTIGAVSNLPVPPTRLVGRDGELAKLAALLRSPDVRLVTLTGPGGSGKTRLAIALAEALAADYPDGVFYVPLAAVTAKEEMWNAIAEVIGVPPEARTTRSQRLAYVGTSSLMVLDNLEQLPEAADVVRELMEAARGVRVVTTSRRPLHLAGEQEHPVPPLGLPDDTARLEEAERSGAVQLFVGHARMVRPDFALSAENVEAVIAICRRLDGLPLAIEFAAARSKLLSPTALLARLERSTGLRARDASGPSRQRTLHAAMAWSYDLLSDDLQRFFRQLGVFAGGADLDAVAAVCDVAIDALEGVEELVDVSLATVSESADGEPRVTLLQTVRDFALERLVSVGESDGAAARHAVHYTTWVEAVAPRLRSSEYLATNDRLEREHANVLDALAWSLRPQSTEPPSTEQIELGVRLCSQLPYFWHMRGGYDTEARRWLQRAVSLARDEGLPLAAALKGLGDLVAMTHEETARELLDHSLAIYRRMDDRAGLCAVLRSLGDLHRDAGDMFVARRYYEEGVALARSSGSGRDVANLLIGLSVLESRLEHLDSALAMITEARDSFRDSGDERRAAICSNNLACVLMQYGRDREALDELANTLPALLQLQSPWTNFYVISTFSEVYARLGDSRRAVRLRATSDAIADWLDSAETQRPPAEAQEWEQLSAAMRQEMSAEEWDAEYRAGRATSVEDAVQDIKHALAEMPRARH
jgi:predicted ATPase/class 3 adenylate cyclase